MEAALLLSTEPLAIAAARCPVRRAVAGLSACQRAPRPVRALAAAAAPAAHGLPHHASMLGSPRRMVDMVGEGSSNELANKVGGRLTCLYGLPTRALTSWTDTNPGRRFAKCGLTVDERCEYFEWLDPECDEWNNVVLSNLEKKKVKAEEKAKEWKRV